MLAHGDGTPADPSAFPDAWPRFRGSHFDAICGDATPLTRRFPPAGPNQLWSSDLGEGYAGAAILHGRVYVLDYDQPAHADTLRCLSLENGKEIWKRAYNVDLTRNHGLSRTVPAVTERFVVTLGPKCHVVCADPNSGEFLWGIDLVREYHATVPQWYAGQCPLIDDDGGGERAILAPGGDCLMIAVDCATGKVLWKTQNPRRWQMTHGSIVPVTFEGKRMYVYCASGGVVGVSADDGAIVWEFGGWKVTMANVPSPLPLGDGRLLLSGGYGAGSLVLEMVRHGSRVAVKPLYRLPPEIFGAEQHTPILYGGCVYGIIAGGQLVCMDPATGKQLWASGAKQKFGLGPFIVADGLIIALSETGTLNLVEADGSGFHPVARARIFEHGHEAWGPLALAGGRLVARDLTRMACFDLRKVAYE